MYLHNISAADVDQGKLNIKQGVSLTFQAPQIFLSFVHYQR